MSRRASPRGPQGRRATNSPLFAPVPISTIETGVEAMTFAVLSVFDSTRGK